MNYRHHFHAGNFADVAKHALVLALVAGLQRKEKGFLYLDTHAGRGAYDLTAESRGDSLARRPEWPDGWGRIERAVAADADGVPDFVREYAAAVSNFVRTQRQAGDAIEQPYPGSPWLVAERLRAQDRAMLCELQPEEAAALTALLGVRRGLRVEERDGYEAVRGCLPPLERRALVLIDPPYEAQDEAERVGKAVTEALRRLPGSTVAVWYPLTARAGAPGFLRLAEATGFPPAWTAELTVAGEVAGLKMSGAGLLVINPPWQLDREVAPAMPWMAEVLAQAPGGLGELRWLSPER